jgi:DNA-binding response OmpR family regulator
MIVDDDPSRRREIFEILRTAGVDVVSASTSEEAMRSVPREKPDLIVVNLVSKGVDGMGFIKELRMYGMGQKIPVAGMVADDKQMKKNARAAGANEILDRNPNPHELVELITKVLGIREFNLPTGGHVQRGVREEDARGRNKESGTTSPQDEHDELPQLTDDAGKGK